MPVRMAIIKKSKDKYWWGCGKLELLHSVGRNEKWNQGVWFFQLCFPFLSLLWQFGVFCICIWILQIFVLVLWKMPLGSLTGVALNMEITLSSIVILTVLILPVQEHGIWFPLFMSSLISFISVLQFSQCKSFASLGRFIPRFVYFFLFNGMAIGIISLISLSDLPLLVNRNERNFCVLILCPVTLPEFTYEL